MAFKDSFFRQYDGYLSKSSRGLTHRYRNLGKTPLSGSLLDSEINYLVDSLNVLGEGIDSIAIGIIPGSDDPLNAGKILTTNGTVLLFSEIKSSMIGYKQIKRDALASACVGEKQIEVNAVKDDHIESLFFDKIKSIFENDTDPDPLNNNTFIFKYNKQFQELQAKENCLLFFEPGSNTFKVLKLSDIWNTYAADNTFSAVQLKEKTLGNSKLIDKTIEGGKVNDRTLTKEHIVKNTLTAEELKQETGIVATTFASKMGDSSIPDSKISYLSGNKIVNKSIPFLEKTKFKLLFNITATIVFSGYVDVTELQYGKVEITQLVENSLPSTYTWTQDTTTLQRFYLQSKTETLLNSDFIYFDCNSFIKIDYWIGNNQLVINLRTLVPSYKNSTKILRFFGYIF